MAADAKRTGKTEVLSMRMDPKTRFLVEIIARLRGQSISTVVERAILEAADNAEIGNGSNCKTWRSFWHVSDGVRALKLAEEKHLYPSYEEELRLDFAKTHWPFFYSDSRYSAFRPWSIDVVWPEIDSYVEIWDRTKSSDYFAAGKAMQKALSDAGIAPPEWPPVKPKPPEKTSSSTSTSKADLDDDIPF